MNEKEQKKKDIIFLTRLLASEYIDKESKRLIKEKISQLIGEILQK